VSMQSPVALSLPFAPSSAAVARNSIKEWLLGLGLPTDVIEDSRLVVSELVGNAVRHASPLADGTVVVAWTRQAADLDIAVTDGGAPTVPRPVVAGDGDDNGRGLSIVEELSNRWWLETSRSRSTVHAVLSLV
jgi:serine/threonine-protein kinase RsbW